MFNHKANSNLSQSATKRTLSKKRLDGVIRMIQIVGAFVGWFAVVTQLYLILSNRTASISETLIRFFSFYTILTNILVATCFTFSLVARRTWLGKFFSRYANITAITLYTMVVGIVYNLILRYLWQPTHMQKLVDELLHAVMPALFIGYWLLFTPKTTLAWRQALSWLIYPLVYVIFIFIRGAFSGFYPYPFIDVVNLGYGAVLLNSFYLVLAFLLIACVLILIARQFILKQK